MNDREKVIKELHDVRRYLEDKEWSDRGASPHIDAINDALAMLKEQEPEEVSIEKRMRICRVMFNRCYAEHGNFMCPYCEFRSICEKERDHDTKRNS